MTQSDVGRLFATPLSRRTTLKGAVALGFTGSLFGTVLRPVTAQDAEYPEMLIVATDHNFDMPATAESGYNRLRLDNQGAEDHHAIFFRLNDDATPEEFQEALMSGDLGAIMALSSAYGGPNCGPGRQSSVIAYLDAGMYVVLCVIPDAFGVPHAAQGMVSMLEVTESDSAATDPAADGTISLIEMAFDGLPAEVESGSYVWEVVNNGNQLHEIVVLQLSPGVTAEMLMGMLAEEGAAATPMAAEAGATPVAMGPPFVSIGGTAPKSPGATNYLEIDLEPGGYIAICFIPDAETGVPHFAMGMVAAFNVT
jgi:hypothetical protein